MAQKRFLKFMQNGQPLVIDYKAIESIEVATDGDVFTVTCTSGMMTNLEKDNAKRLLKHISSDCYLFDKPEEDI